MQEKEKIKLRQEHNLTLYHSAWSCLDSAVSDLEMVQVGLDKALYKKIQRLIEEINGCMLLVSVELIEPSEGEIK